MKVDQLNSLPPLSVVVAALVAMSASAQQEDERFLDPNIFKTADANGDGVVTSFEKDAFM